METMSFKRQDLGVSPLEQVRKGLDHAVRKWAQNVDFSRADLRAPILRSRPRGAIFAGRHARCHFDSTYLEDR